MMIERDLDELKSDIHKIQVAFRAPVENPYQSLNVLHRESRGTVDLLIIRDRKDTVEAVISQSRPVIFDLLPLSLEEIFIYELGGGDNEIESIIF
jgi:ABC-2 type transport system ATP-binding protein